MRYEGRSLERWTGSRWIRYFWIIQNYRPLEAPLSGEEHLIQGVPPGRYRAVDRRIGAISREVVVRGGDLPTLLEFDLRPPCEILGRVRAPGRESLEGACVETVRGGGEKEEIRVGGDGRFVVRLAGPHEEVLLTARHPLLRPDPESGRARIRGPREDLELNLVPGGVTTVLLEVDPDSDVEPTASRRRRVLLLRNPRDRSPAARLPAAFARDENGRWRLRFSDPPAGTFTLWYDPGPTHAPVVVENLRLGEGDAEHGPVRVSRGSAFRARLRGKVPPKGVWLMVRVETLEGPPLARLGMAEGTTLEIPGIGPGRHRIRGGRFRPEEDRLPEDLDEEIVFDGRTVVERAFDLPE
jgi:hypothetical protein